MRLIACLIAVLLAAPAAAQGLFGQKTDYAELSIHAGRAGDGVRHAALRMELKPGWKTYWRNPGDAGIPPQFDWTGSENLAAVEIDWPTPIVFDTYGTRTIGYEDRMILPVTLTPEDPAAPIEVRLNMSYGLCDEICIPASESVALTIAPGAPEDGGWFLDRAMADAPMSAAEGGLVAQTCSVEGAGESRRFSAALTMEVPLYAPPVIIAEGPEGVWFGPVSTTLDGGVIHAEGRVETEAGRWIDRGAVALTILGGQRAVALESCG